MAGISRQALYRPIRTRPRAAGAGVGRPGDEAIVEVAKANPTDGTRMVAAIASRQLGVPVNRKKVQRVMRAHRLLQPARGGDRRRRPGFFRVTRPDELWHMDVTKVWTAAHGWVYLHVIVDCCTREITGWSIDVRTRSVEAIACIDSALLGRQVGPGVLTLGTDNGSQFTSRDTRKHLSALAEWTTTLTRSGLGPKTISDVLTLLRQVPDQATELGWSTVNVVAAICIGRATRRSQRARLGRQAIATGLLIGALSPASRLLPCAGGPTMARNAETGAPSRVAPVTGFLLTEVPDFI